MKIVTCAFFTGLLLSSSADAGLFFNSPPQGEVVITGDARVGKTLTADTSSVSDEDGLGKFSYRWLRNGKSIKGKKAEAAQYTLVDKDLNKKISVRVSYVDGYYRYESLTSASVTILPFINTPPAGVPVVNGTARQGSSLTVDTSGISDEDGLGDFSYQWLRNGVAVSGAKDASYLLTQQDVDSMISVRVSYVDGGNTREAIESESTAAVENVNDAPTGLPVIKGVSTQGQTLTVDVSEIDDIDGLGAFSYQWIRDGVAVVDAVSSSYTLAQADVDASIRVRVSYTDGGDTVESISSDAVGPVENINDEGIVTIGGNATVYSVLHLTDVRDADGISNSSFSYQWFRDGSAIVGETGSSYTVVEDDLDHYFTLQVSYTDDYGTAEQVISNRKGPIFPDVPKVTPPATVGPVPATGWFSYVDIHPEQAKASDAHDGPLTPVPDSKGYFRPGENIVTWSATDSAGNVGTAEQIVKVVPLAEVSKVQRSSEQRSSVDANDQQDNTAAFRISLNGDALEYPVFVSYSISGTAETDGSDHSLIDGKVRLEKPSAGKFAEKTVPFTIVNDGEGEGMETVVISLQQTPKNAVLGLDKELTIQVTESNAAPVVHIEATRVQLDANSGTVTAAAVARDANAGDSLSYDWQSETDNALFGIGTVSANGKTFYFDPADLSPGFYTLGVTVDDGSESVANTLLFNVESVLPELSSDTDSDADGIDDAAEGFADSDGDNIPDYLDAISTVNVMQTQPGVSDGFIMQSEPGVRLSLGELAVKADAGASMIEEDSFGYGSIEPDTITNIGGYFDFVIDDLAFSGQSVQIVIPQLVAMPRLPVYRKLTASGWNDFVSNAKNSVASAAGSEGYCPPPGDAAYKPGLTQGHWCLQLTIEDGGPNDSDNSANNRIRDPGGVGRFLTDVNVKSSGSGSSSLLLTVLTFLIMVTLRRIQRFEIRTA
jgi:large repetitive protein